MLVAEDLHLNVAGAADQCFEIDLVIAKGGQGFVFGQFHHWRQIIFRFDHAHAASAATPAGFEH